MIDPSGTWAISAVLRLVLKYGGGFARWLIGWVVLSNYITSIGRASLNADRLIHIVGKHHQWASLAGGVTRFTNTYWIGQLIHTTLKHGKFVQQGNMWVTSVRFVSQIGVNSAGTPLFVVRVVLDQYLNVITAYPIK